MSLMRSARALGATVSASADNIKAFKTVWFGMGFFKMVRTAN